MPLSRIGIAPSRSYYGKEPQWFRTGVEPADGLDSIANQKVALFMVFIAASQNETFPKFH
jgi:hypothetical protein